VALLGPRQVGKTTLALERAKQRPAVCIDLESEADRAKLSEPELYLAPHADKLVVLDEIQRAPQLFRNLRGLIDAGRRRGQGKGRFLALGSALIDLLLKLPGHRAPWAIEIKRGLAPKIERGFHLACDDVRPGRRLVVYSGTERFALTDAVEAVSLVDSCKELTAASLGP
jgi:predicted AAA+ superfamily ATPase